MRPTRIMSINQMTPRYAQWMEKVQSSAMRGLLALGTDPSIISFSAGHPDVALFLVAQLAYMSREAFFPRPYAQITPG